MTDFGCVEATIRLNSGKYLDLLEPDPGDILIDDIVCGLTKICRFGGQIDAFYSVADHSINAALLAKHWGYDAPTQFACLMHDAAEAYLGDMVRPLKRLLPTFAEYELRIEAAITQAFGVDLASVTTKAYIWDVDNALLIAERNRFFSRDDVAWHGEDTARLIGDYTLRHFSPAVTRECFLRLFEELKAAAIGSENLSGS